MDFDNQIWLSAEDTARIFHLMGKKEAEFNEAQPDYIAAARKKNYEEVTKNKILKKDLEEVVHDVLFAGMHHLKSIERNKNLCCQEWWDFAAVIKPVLHLSRRFYPAQSQFVAECDRVLERIKREVD